jgi:hypothetical protein
MHPPERELVNEFALTFKQAFDHDGGHKAMIKEGSVQPYTLSGEGTLSKPGVKDASQNRGNRGGLLSRFQKVSFTFKRLPPT